MEEFLTVKQVAKIFKRSPGGIYQMVAKKKIPYLRISKKGIRFFQDDIQQWARSLRIAPESSEEDRAGQINRQSKN